MAILEAQTEISVEDMTRHSQPRPMFPVSLFSLLGVRFGNTGPSRLAIGADAELPEVPSQGPSKFFVAMGELAFCLRRLLCTI